MESKRSLTDKFFALNTEQRRLTHLLLCENALKIWNLYANAHKSIAYMETVAGTHQKVDKQLPVDALASVKQGWDSQNVAQRYLEPITAMQDDDLSFPEHITFAYYAIYNLFIKYVGEENIDDWLIVNQALSSETNDTVWNELLDHAIQRSKQ